MLACLAGSMSEEHVVGEERTGSTRRPLNMKREFSNIPETRAIRTIQCHAPGNQELYQRYSALAGRERDVLFLGRLAEYRYYNMDQVVARALMVFEKIISQTRRVKSDAITGKRRPSDDDGWSASEQEMRFQPKFRNRGEREKLGLT